MSKFKDISGQQFGYLTAIRVDESSTSKAKKWVCKCKCGNNCIVFSSDLISGHTQSCGCKRYESRNKIHGLSSTPLYKTWCTMKKRCFDKNEKCYKHYGARGITVCDEWVNDYMAFHQWSIENGYSKGLTIERIDVNGNYCPENCKWITQQKQLWNRTDTIYITDNNGTTKPLAEWCNILNFPSKLADGRYRKLLNSGNEISFDYIFAPSSRKNVKGNQRIYQYSLTGELIKIWNTTSEIKETGLYNQRAVLNCCYGTSKTHKNYVWHFGK